MPINVFGNSFSSQNNSNKTDTKKMVQTPHLRASFIEANIEEDFDMKKPFKIKNLPCPFENKEVVSKSYVDSGLNDPSIIRDTAHFDFNDKNLDNVRFGKINSLPAVRKQLTAKFYVDEAISDSVKKSSQIRLDPDEKLNLDEQEFIVPNSTSTSLKTIIETPTKSYVNRSQENS